VLLVGPSGSGKSTLLRALAGVLLTADTGELSGEVMLGDELVGARAGQAGLLLQDPADAVVASTAGRDVAFGPENVGLDRPEIWRRIAESLAAVRFPYGAERASGQLSGGESQRLALAGALALQPGLLLLDEPTAMLDPESAEVVRRAVLDVARQTGSTLVVVEHRIDEWVDEVDRLLVLSSAGVVVADGEPREVLARYSETLTAQGVWVPGLPAPRPVTLDDGLAGPWRPVAAAGSILLAAQDAGVRDRLAATSVTVAAARVLAVTGPSGSGKSTLLAALAGLTRPSSGAVSATSELAGDLPPAPGRWRSRDLAARIGWVPQHPEQAFVAHTVRDEILAGPLARGDGSGRLDPAAVARADGLIAALSLEQVANTDPHRLSGGEQRRLSVAAALAQGASVLLFDEPTLGQDRATWAAVAGALQAARDQGTAIAVATHDRQLVETLADTEIALSAPGESRGAPGADAGVRGSRGWPPAARCGPLAILAVALLAVLGSVFVRDWRVGLIALGVQVVFAPLAIRSLRATARRLVPGLVAALSIGWSSWLLGGHQLTTGVTAALRIGVLVIPGALLTVHLDPSRLGDDLAQRLRLPARPVVAAVAALQRLEELATVWSEVSWARRVRGLGATRSPISRIREAAHVTFALLVQTIRRAGRMAVAMDARGFAAAHQRSWAEPSRWGRSDTVLLLIGLVVAAIPLTLDVTWL
jgi:energy-coupling factor transport system permease/ATP-binding protein